ncbi:hypothetical protein LINPERHAP2_LOCUS19757 [Linum perenne]
MPLGDHTKTYLHRYTHLHRNSAMHSSLPFSNNIIIKVRTRTQINLKPHYISSRVSTSIPNLHHKFHTSQVHIY